MPHPESSKQDGGRLQRSSSCSGFEPEKKRKTKTSTPKKAYQGRMSLGGSRSTTIAMRVEQRRKSRLNHHQYDDDEVDVDNYTPGTSSSSRNVSSTRLFNCLSIEDAQEMSPSVNRKVSSVSSSASTLDFAWEEPDDPHIVGDVDRRCLYNAFYSFLDRDSKSSNLVVNQDKVKAKNGHIFSFKVEGRHEQHKLGDYLWLVLKAYFAGKDVRGHYDAAIVYDPQICRLREEKIVVLNDLLNFHLEHSFRETMIMSFEYLQDFVRQRERILHLLDELDRFEALFPHNKAMLSLCQKRFNMDVIKARVEVLYAWINTADQLCDKIEQFGHMLGVSQSAVGAEGWPRPLHGIAPTDRDSAYTIVRTFVAEMLSVKIMRKVLNRVSHLCDEVLLRATILLQQPAGSYAQAAGTQRTVIHMTDEMRDKYGENVRGCLWLSPAREMNLPSLLPLFVFVLGVRVQMVLEWLDIRAAGKLPLGSETDLMTLKTFVEESRDCIEEAVRVKRHYLGTISYTCKNANDFLPHEFDDLLARVFDNHLSFIAQLALAFYSPHSPMACLFNHLEKEWKATWKCASCVNNGIETLTKFFCKLLCETIDRVVINFWEAGVYRITEGLDDNSVGSDLESDGGETEIRRRRHLNILVREAYERSARAFTVVRLMLNDLMTVSCFITLRDHHTVAISLRDHVLIAPDNREISQVEWPVSMLCRPMDHGTLQQFLTTICEGGVPDGNHLIVLPIPFVDFSSTWKWERATVPMSSKIAKSLFGFRTDRVLVVGHMVEPLHRRFPSVFKLCSQNSAAYANAHKEMMEFASRLDVFSQTIAEKVYDVIAHRSFVDSSGRRAAHSVLLTMFNFCFQFHRDVGKVVWEVHELRSDFAERCVRLLEKWRELVPANEARRSPHIPVWAKAAFTFVLHVSDPQWTQHLNDTLFARLRAIHDFCQNDIVGAETVEQPARTSRYTGERDSGYVSPRISNGVQDRGERLRTAAADLDEALDKRRMDCVPLGHIVQKRREEYTVTNYTNANKKAPFQWQLLEKIGEGNFGDVYKALNVDKGCVIAVKQIRTRGQMLKILEGEVDILRHLSHKNLVKYYGMEVQADDVLILMEFCAEGTLEKICREGLDMSLVRRYANHLLQAVEYIHDNKVIHRDIKPANIFLDLSCVLKLGDFGSSIRLSNTATVRGEFRDFVGTPSYMAPETYTGGQVLGVEEGGRKQYRGYGRAVDIWSIGCVVLEMVTGRRPFDKYDMYQIALALGNKKKPTYPTKCPSILQHFLDLCLEFDDSKRPTASTMLNDPFVNVHTDPQGTIERRLFL